jgi:hypothetical protein
MFYRNVIKLASLSLFTARRRPARNLGGINVKRGSGVRRSLKTRGSVSARKTQTEEASVEKMSDANTRETRIRGILRPPLRYFAGAFS